MTASRRDFIYASLGLAACTRIPAPGANPLTLHEDPTGILDLPAGFDYRIISRAFDPMSDGLRTPARPDGMACFAGDNGELLLVRNHENLVGQNHYSAFGDQLEMLDLVPRDLFYDWGKGEAPGTGGTTTLAYDPSRREVTRSYLSLAGTELNCAGGPTPWGTWLSCEECFDEHLIAATAHFPREKSHGFVFEVDPRAERLLPARPLKALGKFVHEAAAVDPRTGAVYLTEDRRDSLLYRLLPNTPRDLGNGGRFQALAFADRQRNDTANRGDYPLLARGSWHDVEWLDLTGADSDIDDLRLRGRALGGARFVRGEGIWYADGEIFFACTEGGPDHLGQVFRYRPEPRGNNGRLSLLAESQPDSVLQHADNLTVTGGGSLIVCEDREDGCGLVIVNHAGETIRFARHRNSNSELAGACFSPDYKTLFVNIQKEGLTLAITGPFASLERVAPAPVAQAPARS